MRLRTILGVAFVLIVGLCLGIASFAFKSGSYVADEKKAVNAPNVSELRLPPEPAGPSRRTQAVLVIAGPDSPFSAYYAEVLRAEGFGVPDVAKPEEISSERLATADIVLLASQKVSSDAVSVLDQWVRAGGGLISMRPPAALSGLTGLGLSIRSVDGAYMLPDRLLEASRGIVQETIQIHGPADLHAAADGVVVAQLYADAERSLGAPAIFMRKVDQGHVVSYAFDLATSIVQTRQGNPAWLDQERDGYRPRRANDLFFPDHVDLKKIAIPQADEQQRLLANLILTMARKPLPRFWYLPGHRRVAILMAGDDHATPKGTSETFKKLLSKSAPGCRPDHWECPRATSYLTASTTLSKNQAERFSLQGFEIAPHVDTGCRDRSTIDLRTEVRRQFSHFRERYPGFATLTHRIHCIVWNGWTTVPELERDQGVKFDLNYYYWPSSWIQGRSGYMTGSGLPMRYANLFGRVLDIYQAETHIVSDNDLPKRRNIRELVDAALDERQYFAILGTHYDYTDELADLLLETALDRKIALVSSAQVLNWLDARERSSLDRLTWDGKILAFEANIANRDDIYVDIPAHWHDRRVTEVACEGKTLPHSLEQVKGITYASFAIRSGQCVILYEKPEASPPAHVEVESRTPIQ